MGYILKLKRGSRTLDLSSGVYTLDQWVPPRANIISNIASGSSANRYGGGVKVSERAVNTSTAFTLRIQGGSNAECEYSARAIENFLRLAGDEADPTYLEWRPDNNVSLEPTWGQFGANVRYEIVSGQIDRWNSYFIAAARETTMFVNVLLELKPFALGKRQRLATAKGGIVEMVAGNPYGESRGINISRPRTNFCTNPIFGHSTYSTHWSASGTGIVASSNSDADYVLFGDTSVRLHSTADDTHYSQYISLTGAVIYTASCYVKMQDSGTPTTDQFKVRMQGGAAPTIRQIGNGWWMLYNNFTPGSTDTYSFGLQLMDNVTAYFGGMQVEARSIPTPLIHGDQLGASWSGTIHASTSARGTASLYVPVADSLKFGEFTIRAAFMPEFNSSNTTSAILFDTSSDNEITGFINTGTISFRVGANQINSGSMTWNINDKIITHFVAQPGEMKIYYGGTQIASGTAFSLPAPGANLYIGNDTGEANPINSTLMGFTTFPHAMTAAEVLADYTNAAEVVNGGDGLGQQLDPIPYLWTKDGDDNFNFSDSGSYSNWGVIGGIPGNVPSETEIEVSDASSAALLSNGDIYLSKFSMNYGDYASATALTYNGPGTISVGASEVGIGTLSIPRQFHEILGGQGFAFMVRGRGTSTDNLTMRTRLTVNGQNINSDLEPVHFEVSASDTSIDTTPFISFPAVTPLYQRGTLAAGTMTAYVRAVRTSGTENFVITSAQIVPRPMTRIDAPAAYGAHYMGGKAVTRVFGGGMTMYYLPVYGDVIEYEPGKYNTLIFNTGAEEIPTDPADSAQLTCRITPRWSIA